MKLLFNLKQMPSNDTNPGLGNPISEPTQPTPPTLPVQDGYSPQAVDNIPSAMPTPPAPVINNVYPEPMQPTPPAPPMPPVPPISPMPAINAPMPQGPVKKKSKKKLLIIPFILFILVLLVILTLVIKTGDQVVASAFLDSIGQHKIALGLDLSSKKNAALLTSLGGANLSNPESCQKVWNSFKEAQIFDSSASSYSAKATLEIRPTSTQYKDSLALQMYLDGRVNLNNAKIYAGTDTTLNADLNLIADLSDVTTPATPTSSATIDNYQSYVAYYQGKYDTATADTDKTYYMSQLDYYKTQLAQAKLAASSTNSTSALLRSLNWGNTSINFKGQGILSTSGAFTKIDNLGLKNNEFNVNGGLESWYGVPTNLTSTQASGVKDIINVSRDILANQYKKVLGEATGQYAMQVYCEDVESVVVDGPMVVEFGTGDNKESRNVRPIHITTKQVSNETLGNQMSIFFERLHDDAQFKSFVKGQYDNLGKYAEAYSKLSGGTTPTIPSRADYEKSVDASWENMLGKESRDQLVKSIKSETAATTAITSQDVNSVLYLDMKTGDYYGAKQQQTIKLDPKLLSTSQISQKLKDVIADGISIKTELYGISSGAQASTIDEPSTYKPITQLLTDVQGTSAFGKLMQAGQ